MAVDTHSAYRSTHPQTNQSVLSFSARTTEPQQGQVGANYYIRKADGGLNGVRYEDTEPNAKDLNKRKGCSGLYNCVSYAAGRVNEINGAWKWDDLTTRNGGEWWKGVPKAHPEFKQSQVPQVGAVMCWSKSGGAGHVAIVEKVIGKKNGVWHVAKSESAYNYDYNKSKSGWQGWEYVSDVSGPNYGMGNSYTFQGFLIHPTLPLSSSVKESEINAGSTTASTTTTQTAEEIEAANQKAIAEWKATTYNTLNQTRGLDLLSSYAFVESPFIEVQIGDYTFGSYTQQGTLAAAEASVRFNYPNYMESLSIIKTNGTLNVYTLNMIYQIVPGKDPNLIDRILSTVSDSRKITLSYGDWALPSFIYRKEEALITKVESRVDFASQKITYTLSCTSTALLAASQTFDFAARTQVKVSDIIKNELLKNDHYGLLTVFPGMENAQLVADSNLIPGDDKPIDIDAKTMDPIKYLNYLVGSMCSTTNTDDATIKDSTYHLMIMDDVENEFGGAYFKIVKVGTSTRNLVSADTYEVDIGFPTNTLVTEFNINTDNSWSILYNYADKITTNNYIYSINDDGIIHSDYVANTSTVSAYYNRETEINKTWWTKMTQFPITAELTIKGLLRPAILMNYLRINTYFYGQKHISSGMYIITKQEDTINAEGYRTKLSLTRISGDDDETYSLNPSSSVEDLNTDTLDAVKEESAQNKDTSAYWSTR